MERLFLRFQELSNFGSPRQSRGLPGLIKFGRVDIVKRFLDSRLTGVYFSVLQEGEVGTGDKLELISRDENHITIADITQLYIRETKDLELLQRVLQVQALPNDWRDYFQKQIEKQRT